MALEQTFPAYKSDDVLIDLVVKDKAKARVSIDAARFAMVEDPATIDTPGTYIIDRQITVTPSPMNGQITDSANGEATFFINNADQAAITRKGKEGGGYWWMVKVRKTGDSKFITVAFGYCWWYPSIPVWTP